MSMNRREFLVSSAVTTAIGASGIGRVAHAAAAGDPDVIVIGAGLSGLETALTLEENGLKVRVLEGRRRIGGRVYTLFDVPGHPEVGGNSIANAYGRCIGAAQKHGVEIVNLAPQLFANRAGQELYVDGEHVLLKDWAAHARNPFQPELKKLPPWAWSDAMFRQHMPFKDLENWYDPKYAPYDVSVHDFLASKGASDAMIRLGFETNISYGTNARDVSLLQMAFSDYWQAVNRGAILGFSRTGAASPGGGAAAGGAAAGGAAAPGSAAPGAGGAAAGAPSNILVGVFKGGNQNLPLAMAKAIKGDLLQGQRVVSIAVTDSGAKVTCADGSTHRAKAVVCTVPFSVLRDVAIDPLPPSKQWKAIQTLGYIPITQFHLVAKKPYWEADGLSPSMWTNGPLGIVMAQRFGKGDEVTSLTVWCRGQAALFIDRLGPEGGKQLVISEIEKLRPAAKGMLRVAGMHSWNGDPFAGGDWAIFQPGQITDFRAELAQPHQRLFFAGEHTSVGSRGMEGAFESAERVSLEVLSALG